MEVNTNTFTKEDLDLIKQRGLTEQDVEQQLNRYEKGFDYADLIRACTISDGILSYNEEEISNWVEYYNSEKSRYNVAKFVPASGAASRMFKHLLNGDESNTDYQEFFEKIDRLALDYDLNDKSKEEVLDIVINDLKLHTFPKGLIPFHRYATHIRTAFDEQCYEAVAYTEEDGKCRLHFTVAEDHLEKIQEHLNNTVANIERDLEIELEVSYSFQQKSTDSLAVDEDYQPFRLSDGNLLFRPAGHGALLENLQNLDNEIVFIKNIDNVVVESKIEDTIKYKEALAGVLLYYKDFFDKICQLIEDGKMYEAKFYQTVNILINELGLIDIELSYNHTNVEFLFDILNRPMRVCGVVKNVGEPGGGPFWVRDIHGHQRRQIVETAQIDRTNSEQEEILQSATHFNPVDLVCTLKNHKGEKYNLSDFIDKESGFVVQKSHEGRDLYSIELPGLWNGAMAYWNTIFVEVPLSTFNPVKTINDLFRDMHQA